MTRKTIAERKALKEEKLQQLKDQLLKLEVRAAERIGRLAVRAGLADVDVEDSILLAELESLAERFRTRAAQRASGGAGPSI